MKMKPEHYKRLKDGISALGKERIQSLRKRLEKGNPNIKDMDMAVRWDAMWETGLVPDKVPVYGYLNDDHIDTALRSIMREIMGE